MTSKLTQMQARFQQKQMQEREEKLLKLYENQQQRAFERVGRGSAGSNTSIGSTGGGKVRQMFDERRQKAGVDRSYPLEPLRSKPTTRGGSIDRKTTASRTVVKSTVQNSISSVRNGKPIINNREVVHSIYNNNDGDESYEEHRYAEDSTDTFNSKSHREMIEMMNNHNLDDDLDDEEMPKIGFDEVDDAHTSYKLMNIDAKIPSQNVLVNKPKPLKSVTKSSNVSATTKNNNTVAKKTSRPPPLVPAKTVLSPRNTTQPSKTSKISKTTNTANATNSVMQSAKPKNSQGAPRTPSATRPSAKQTARTGVVRDDLTECNYCGRRFAADRIQKHEDICSKTGKKKRKAYDATKHRVVGTELETYVLKSAKGKSSFVSNKPSKQSAKKDWRKTHEEFIAAIRAAKEAQAYLAKGGKLADLPPPPPSSNPDYVQCPHCGRRFNESAAERHIPKCANFQFNKPKPGAPPKGKTGKK